MSRVASDVRSVRVSSGASPLRRSSAFLGLDFAIVRPSVEVVFIVQDNKHQSRATCANERIRSPSFRIDQLLLQRVVSAWENAATVKFAGLLIERLVQFGNAMPE